MIITLVYFLILTFDGWVINLGIQRITNIKTTNFTFKSELTVALFLNSSSDWPLEYPMTSPTSEIDIIGTLERHLNAQDCTWQRRKRILNTLALFNLITAKQGRKHSVFEALETLFHQVLPPPRAATITPAAVCKELLSFFWKLEFALLVLLDSEPY